MSTDTVKEFLQTKMKEDNSDIKDIAAHTKIPETSLRGVMDGRQPGIAIVLKIADAYDLSIDEVLGRENFTKGRIGPYSTPSIEELQNNLKNFINTHLEKEKITQYELGKNIGRSADTFRSFLKEDDNKTKMLNTETMIALGNHCDVSIDEMLGRTSALEREQMILKSRNHVKQGELQRINPEILKAAQLIGKSVEDHMIKTPETKADHTKSLNNRRNRNVGRGI